MYKYAVLNLDNLCVDIIEVSDINTLDGYSLPNEECSLIMSSKWNNEAQIGLYFNESTNEFQ